MELAKKVILITGAGSGLGAATAKRFAAAGAHIALMDLNLQNMQALAQQLNGLATAADVSDAAQVETGIQAIVKKYGAIHGCINCAGIAPAERVVGRNGAAPLENFERVININLVGTFNVVRLVAAQMSQQAELADQERGVIINTASVAAFEGQIGQAAYSASKGGVAAMTLPLARELSRFGIRVMTIAPGVMQTPMMTGMPDNVQASLSAAVPFPARLGYPEEFAQLAQQIFENQYLNGTVIRLDGGLRMAGK